MSEPPTYRPGEQVWVQLASRPVLAEVLEDRGRLGAGGERIVRVRWTPTDTDEPLELDVSESQVRPEARSFEEQVRTLIEQAGGKVGRIQDHTGGFTPDFILSTPTRTILVEAKAFQGDAAPRQVRELERRLLDARNRFHATEALLVVPSLDRVLVHRTAPPGVTIVPLAGLNDWLASHRD